MIGFPPTPGEQATRLYERAQIEAEVAARGGGALLVMFLAWYIPVVATCDFPWWAHPLAWLGLVLLCSDLKDRARATLKAADALAEQSRASKRQPPPSHN